jgi:hypothetical protein
MRKSVVPCWTPLSTTAEASWYSSPLESTKTLFTVEEEAGHFMYKPKVQPKQ